MEMSQGLLNQIAAIKLQQLEPEIYDECAKLVKPPMTDIKLLPMVLRELLKVCEATPANSAFIVAVVYFLLQPYKLYYKNVRGKNHIRQALCSVMKWKDAPTVNYYSNMAIFDYKNRNWAAKVKQTALMIKARVEQEVQDGD